jgi:hypothetical protein
MADPRVPSDKIEITPEMIKAGARVLLADPMTTNLSAGFAELIAEDVIRAAIAAKHGRNLASENSADDL